MNTINIAKPYINPILAGMPGGGSRAGSFQGSTYSLAGRPIKQTGADGIRAFTEPSSIKVCTTLKFGESPGDIRAVNLCKEPPPTSSKRTGEKPSVPKEIQKVTGIIYNKKSSALLNQEFKNREAADKKAQEIAKSKAVDPGYKLTIKLDSNRQVVLRARKNGEVFIEIPDKSNLFGKPVSLNVRGVTTKSSKEQIAQAVTTLGNNLTAVSHVYDREGRPVKNSVGSQPVVEKTKKTSHTDRESFMRSIEFLPPLIKEAVGFAGGV